MPDSANSADASGLERRGRRLEPSRDRGRDRRPRSRDPQVYEPRRDAREWGAAAARLPPPRRRPSGARPRGPRKPVRSRGRRRYRRRRPRAREVPTASRSRCAQLNARPATTSIGPSAGPTASSRRWSGRSSARLPRSAARPKRAFVSAGTLSRSRRGGSSTMPGGVADGIVAERQSVIGSLSDGIVGRARGAHQRARRCRSGPLPVREFVKALWRRPTGSPTRRQGTPGREIASFEGRRDAPGSALAA